MKKKTLFKTIIFSLFTALSVTAQDTIPKLTIDSTLMVGDSAAFGTNVHVGDRMTVEGVTNLRDDVTAAKDFTVEENAYFKGDLTTLGTIFYPGVPTYSGSLSEKGILIFDPISNQIEKSTLGTLQNQLYSKLCFATNGIVLNPTWSNDTNRIFVDCPDIRVGIGTDHPLQSLHVAGSQLLQGTLQSGNIGLGTTPSTFSRFLIKNSNHAAGIEINNTGNSLQFNKMIFLQYDNPSTELIKVVNTSTGTVPFFLEANGRMTIHNGTQKILQLNPDGVLQTRIVKVDAYQWPDYVFTPTYQLRPLSEVKSYIAENGHLPEVPSAEVAESEGVDVGEMNKILLQKVEELTLYIIQQEERIKALEALNK